MQMESNENLYYMTQDQRGNINKRLPIGFCLVKLSQRETYNKKPFQGQIKYIPQKPVLRKSISESNANQFPVPMTAPNNLKLRGSHLAHSPREATLKKQNSKHSDYVSTIKGKSIYQAPETKSRQAQKIKNIIQRIRKHPKFSSFGLHMTKLGFYSSFAQIEAESKRNLLSIDSFKQRCLQIFTTVRNATYMHQTLQLIDQMIDQFIFYVDQAKRIEFSNSLTAIQTNIDKITRQFTNIKEQGNWYLRKKKKSQKNFDQKEILYIAELVKQLPLAYLIGVWQIIEEKPFPESFNSTIEIDLKDLKQKKLRQIEAYVKKKIVNLNKSRMTKIQKVAKKKLQKFNRQRQAQAQKQKMNQSEKDKTAKKQDDLDVDLFRTPNRSQVDASASQKLLQDSKNQVRSQISQGNSVRMPPTPQFLPKKNKEIPTFQNLKTESPSTKLFNYKQDKKKSNGKESLMQQIFPEEQQLKYPNVQQQDDFLNLNDFEKRSDDFVKQQPRLIDSPLWNQFDQSSLIKGKFQLGKQKSEKEDFDHQLEFEPLESLNAKKQAVIEERQKSEIMNPPSFDQAQQFIRNDQSEKDKVQNEVQDQQQDQYESEFTSSDSSMITDEDDSEI